VYEPQAYTAPQNVASPPLPDSLGHSAAPPLSTPRQRPPSLQQRSVDPPAVQTRGPPPGPRGAPPPPVQARPGPPPQMRGAPAGPSRAPPQQPVSRAPAKPAMPDFMVPFVKMQKMGVPKLAILNKMRQQKVDPSNYDKYLGSGGSSASGAPRDPLRGSPAQPRGGPPSMQPAAAVPPRAPPARGGGLMSSIRQGTTLQKAAPARKPPPSRGGGLLDSIRSGSNLKKASDRQLAPRVIEYNVRDQTMQAITTGVKLRKAKKSQAPKQAADDSNDIFALMKMRKLLEVSDDEDSSGSEDWSDG